MLLAWPGCYPAHGCCPVLGDHSCVLEALEHQSFHFPTCFRYNSLQRAKHLKVLIFFEIFSCFSWIFRYHCFHTAHFLQHLCPSFDLQANQSVSFHHHPPASEQCPSCGSLNTNTCGRINCFLPLAHRDMVAMPLQAQSQAWHFLESQLQGHQHWS